MQIPSHSEQQQNGSTAQIVAMHVLSSGAHVASRQPQLGSSGAPTSQKPCSQPNGTWFASQAQVHLSVPALQAPLQHCLPPMPPLHVPPGSTHPVV